MAEQSPLVTELLFQIAALGLPAPVLELRFAPPRRWRFDLSWPEHEPKLAMEVDGATWTGGRHTSGAGYERDCEKLAEAALLGWRVIRVTSGMIRDGRAISLIERALQEKAHGS